jgi:hypothetical protein
MKTSPEINGIHAYPRKRLIVEKLMNNNGTQYKFII